MMGAWEVKSYRDLIVWRKAIELAGHAYRVAGKLPKVEMFEMSSQIRRAAVSIPSNIAEGHARNHTKEFLQFLGIANGSLAELQTLLVLSETLGYCEAADTVAALTASEEVGKILGGLMSSLTPGP